ncbi:T9SS type A sorting domain-containing protein [candidate division KSB1 bacterium]|nr:T9SS type A sorting domain-containing protein [candidate division KSB1 bacterium]
MKRIYYFMAGITLFYSLLAAQVLCFDPRVEAFLSYFQKLQQRGQVTERQVAETVSNLGCPVYSSSDVTELVDVLHEGPGEDRLKAILLRLIEKNHGGWADKDDDDNLALFHQIQHDGNFTRLPVFQQQAGMPDDFRVNENLGRSDKEEPAVAMNDAGNLVVVWEDRDFNGFSKIFCQRYAGNGTPLGDKFRVVEYFSYSTILPDVAIDPNGNFTVVWSDQRSTPNNPDIYFQRFTNNGEPLGTNEKVNTDGVTCSHSAPAIGMDNLGNFVIVWNDDHRLGSFKNDIYCQRYSSSGIPLGGNFMISDISAERSNDPAIAVDSNGNFIVVWSLSTAAIYCRRYNSSGTPLEDNFQVNSLWGGSNPDVDVDDSGNFVIVWAKQNDGLYGRRYNSSGTALGDQFDVHDAPAGSSRYYRPSLSVRGNGSFVVIWEDQRNDTNFSDSNSWVDLYYQRFDSAAQPIGSNLKVNEFVPNLSYYYTSPVSAMDSNGNFLFVWNDQREGYHDIYCQRYQNDGTLEGANFRLNNDNGTVNQRFPTVGVDGQGNFVIAWEDFRKNVNVPDIYCQRYDNSGAALGPNFMVSDAGLVHYLPDIDANQSGDFVVVWYDVRSEYHEIYGQRYNSFGAALGVNFRISEEAISSFTRVDPAVCIDENGNFWVAWEDRRNGDWDIYCQRFNNNGTAQGANFKVNADAGTTAQEDPAIGFDGNGNCAIAWEDSRNGDDDIYCQKFKHDGTPDGDNFIVNDDAAGVGNYNPDIAVYDDGSFVVVWFDNRNGSRDIFCQRYSSSGDLIGANFKVNDNTESFDQWSPSVEVDYQGNFAVVWYTTYDTYGTDNEVRDIYCRRFDRDGSPAGASYQMNSNTNPSIQHYPRVALANRRIIAVWEDGRNTLTANDIYARMDMYNAPPPSPTPTSPETNSYAAANPPILAFNISSDDDDDSLHFKVEVASDNNFTYPLPGSPFESRINSVGFSPLPPLAAGTSSGSYAFQSALNAGTYFWRVSAHDGFGYGDASAIYSFIIETAPPFTSDHRPQKYAQEAAIDTDISFHIKDTQSGVEQSSIVMKLGGIQVTPDISGTPSDYAVSYDPPTDFTYNQTVTVTIDAEDFAGNKMNTEGYYFITAGPGNQAPEAPVLTSPADRSCTKNNIPTLTWTVPSDANNDSLHFKVEAAKDINFSTPIYGSPFESRNNLSGFSPAPPAAQDYGACSYTLQFILGDGTYYWRVSATDGSIYGAASTTYQFTIDTAPPYTVEHNPPKSALNIDVNTNITVHVKDDICGADSGSITMKVNGLLVNRRIAGTPTDYTVTFQSPSPFAYNVMVNVAVDAADIAGNQMHTDSYTFSTCRMPNVAPEVVQLTAPANNSIITNNKPMLSWSAPSDDNGDSLHFKVEIATDSNFSNSIYGSPFESRYHTTGFNPVPPVAESSGAGTFTVPFLLEASDYWWRVTARDAAIYGEPSETWKFTIRTNSVKQSDQSLPENYTLYQNHPNPFNPITTISYALPKPGSVLLQIFDIDGRLVTNLVDGFQAAGIHSINWTAKDKTGKSVTSGIYICRLTAGNLAFHQKMMLVK